MSSIHSDIKPRSCKQAWDYIAKIDLRSASREDRLALARLARISQLPQKALKILRPNLSGYLAPNGIELLEYANSLYSVGAVKNALALLQEKRTDWPDLRATIRENILQEKHLLLPRQPDVDRALVTMDRKLIEKLYFGSPSKQFRERLGLLLPLQSRLPSYYCLGSDPLTLRVFHLAAAKEESSEAVLKLGQSLHRLFASLICDFYSPIPVGALFEQLFPGEIYDPWHTPTRIHQYMRRLRRWLSHYQIPIEIIEKGGAYRLVFTGPYSILIPLSFLDLLSEDPLLIRLRSALPSRPFSTSEAANLLGVSARFAFTLLSAACEKHWLVCSGNAKNTRYEWKS